MQLKYTLLLAAIASGTVVNGSTNNIRGTEQVADIEISTSPVVLYQTRGAKRVESELKCWRKCNEEHGDSDMCYGSKYF